VGYILKEYFLCVRGARGKREHVRGLVQWDWALSAGGYKYQAVAVRDIRH